MTALLHAYVIFVVWIVGLVVLLRFVFPKLALGWRVTLSLVILLVLLIGFVALLLHISDNVPGAQ